MNTAFLLSNWYSGATLFSLLIDKHPDVVCNGETFPFSKSDKRRHLCSCGAYIDECDFYNKTTSIDKKKNFPMSWDYNYAVICPEYSRKKLLNSFFSSPVRDGYLRSKLAKILRVDKTERRFLTQQRNFAQKAIEYSNARIYVDGTKSIRRAQLFAHHFPKEKIKIIHLVRDGRAFCNSYLKNRKMKETNIIKAAKEWNDYISLIDKLERGYPNLEIISIRYEDLCRKRCSTMENLFDFFDLNYSESCLQKGQASHMLGNRMRKSYNFDIREDLSWKEQLSENSIELITDVMRLNLIRFSYL